MLKFGIQVRPQPTATTFAFSSVFQVNDNSNCSKENVLDLVRSRLFLKGQCYEIYFRPFFLLKRFDQDPIRYSIAKFEMACPRTVRSQRLAVIFSLDTEIFIFLNYCYSVFKHTQVLFSPDCSFKICEKPSKFFKKVRIVLSVDHADTVSS